MSDFQLKNLYDEAFFEKFTQHCRQRYPAFQTDLFVEKIFDDAWAERALKERMRHVTHCLQAVLPVDYRAALAVLRRISEGLDTQFQYIFFSDFVEVYGLEDFEASAEALRDFTPLCSSEFAVRPFIEKYPELMLPLLLEWAGSENHHVRRLASEGCRPKLPWGGVLRRFVADPKPILPILERLKDDESEYVRRSVANNLNDISKDHPDLVLDIAKRWRGFSKNRDKLLKHALRTLLKQGNTKALILFGFADPDAVKVEAVEMSPISLRIGEAAVFSFSLSHAHATPTSLRLEYAIYFVKKNGQLSKKVFQLKEAVFESKEVYTFKKKQDFKNLTTRTHYAGQHFLAILVNGEEKARLSFELQD